MSPHRGAGRRLSMVVGWLAVLALWVAAGWWVVAVHPLTGPVLLVITETRGLHVGDIPVLALAAATSVWRWRTTAAYRPSSPA